MTVLARTVCCSSNGSTAEVEEARGGLEYAFHEPGTKQEEKINARAALGHFDRTGESPLMKWQTHLFEMKSSVPKGMASS